MEYFLNISFSFTHGFSIDTASNTNITIYESPVNQTYNFLKTMEAGDRIRFAFNTSGDMYIVAEPRTWGNNFNITAKSSEKEV